MPDTVARHRGIQTSQMVPGCTSSWSWGGGSRDAPRAGGQYHRCCGEGWVKGSGDQRRKRSPCPGDVGKGLGRRSSGAVYGEEKARPTVIE